MRDAAGDALPHLLGLGPGGSPAELQPGLHLSFAPEGAGAGEGSRGISVGMKSLGTLLTLQLIIHTGDV